MKIDINLLCQFKIFFEYSVFSSSHIHVTLKPSPQDLFRADPTRPSQIRTKTSGFLCDGNVYVTGWDTWNFGLFHFHPHELSIFRSPARCREPAVGAEKIGARTIRGTHSGKKNGSKNIVRTTYRIVNRSALETLSWNAQTVWVFGSFPKHIWGLRYTRAVKFARDF